MSTSLNFETREAPGGSFSLVHQTTQRLRNPQYGLQEGASKWKAGYTESTGQRTVVKFTGFYAELVAMAKQMHSGMASGGDTQVTWEVTQLDGPHGEMRVTSEVFRVPFEDDSTNSGGSTDDTTDTMPGDDESYPEINIQTNCTEEPLLTHPKYSELDIDTLQGLHALMNGGSMGDLLTAADGKQKMLGELIKGAPDKLVRKVLKGQTHYYCPHTVVTIRHKGRSTGGTAGKIGHTSGLPAAGRGMTWFCHGTGVEKCGPDAMATSVWESGNWDEDLYG